MSWILPSRVPEFPVIGVRVIAAPEYEDRKARAARRDAIRKKERYKTDAKFRAREKARARRNRLRRKRITAKGR